MEVYLDQAATSWPKPLVVSAAIKKFIDEVGVSAGRGSYRRALEADRVVFETRVLLARLLRAEDPAQIIFTANATEALNLALKGLLKRGDHVITSSMEHNAVWRPLKTLERERGVEISVVPCAPDGTLDPAKVAEALRPNTRLITLLHASNVTGTIMPITEVGEIARANNVLFLVDSAQTAGVLPLDVKAQKIDLLAFTGHKGLLGPPGTGGLYLRKGIRLETLKEGGTGSESYLETQPETLPDRYEAGTLNTYGLAGLGAAVNYLLNEGIPKIRAQEEELTAYLLEGLRQIEGIEIYGPQDPQKQVGTVSFNLAGLPPEEVGYVLDQNYSIMVRVGLHCAPLAHRTVGTFQCGTLRASLGYFNTREEIKYFLTSLREISRSFSLATLEKEYFNPPCL